jgi:hypothetical protein
MYDFHQAEELKKMTRLMGEEWVALHGQTVLDNHPPPEHIFQRIRRVGLELYHLSYILFEELFGEGHEDAQSDRGEAVERSDKVVLRPTVPSMPTTTTRPVSVQPSPSTALQSATQSATEKDEVLLELVQRVKILEDILIQKVQDRPDKSDIELRHDEDLIESWQKIVEEKESKTPSDAPVSAEEKQDVGKDETLVKEVSQVAVEGRVPEKDEGKAPIAKEPPVAEKAESSKPDAVEKGQSVEKEASASTQQELDETEDDRPKRPWWRWR